MITISILFLWFLCKCSQVFPRNQRNKIEIVITGKAIYIARKSWKHSCVPTNHCTDHKILVSICGSHCLTVHVLIDCRRVIGNTCQCFQSVSSKVFPSFCGWESSDPFPARKSVGLAWVSRKETYYFRIGQTIQQSAPRNLHMRTLCVVVLVLVLCPLVQARRGGASTSGGFTLRSASANRAGNDEEMELGEPSAKDEMERIMGKSPAASSTGQTTHRSAPEVGAEISGFCKPTSGTKCTPDSSFSLGYDGKDPGFNKELKGAK